MRFSTVRPRRALLLLGWAAALVAGGASSALLIRPEQDEVQQLPAWMSITTANLTDEAKQCYRREAKWQASTYCASPVDDVVEVVWASCFGEEQRVLLAAIEDSASDAAGMKFLADLEHQSRGDVVPMIREGQSTSARCSNSDSD
jgi:hypothetical protein